MQKNISSFKAEITGIDSDSDDVYSIKIYTDIISGLQKNITIYNNHIFLIYD